MDGFVLELAYILSMIVDFVVNFKGKMLKLSDRSRLLMSSLSPRYPLFYCDI